MREWAAMLRAALWSATLLAAGSVQASQFEVFLARCLAPFETASPPVTEGLTQLDEADGVTAYALPEGYVMLHEAGAACSVLGRYVRGEALRFEIWALDMVSAGRLVEQADGRFAASGLVLGVIEDVDSLTMRVDASGS